MTLVVTTALRQQPEHCRAGVMAGDNFAAAPCISKRIKRWALSLEKFYFYFWRRRN